MIFRLALMLIFPIGLSSTALAAKPKCKKPITSIEEYKKQTSKLPVAFQKLPLFLKTKDRPQFESVIKIFGDEKSSQLKFDTAYKIEISPSLQTTEFHSEAISAICLDKNTVTAYIADEEFKLDVNADSLYYEGIPYTSITEAQFITSYDHLKTFLTERQKKELQKSKAQTGVR